MQGIAMVRIGGEDLLVTLRGRVELARLVMLDRDPQDLFNVVRHGFILCKPSIDLDRRVLIPVATRGAPIAYG